ncbi:MAG: ABC transporter substrate-binding protein [Promethearchaeota archaeon]
MKNKKLRYFMLVLSLCTLLMLPILVTTSSPTEGISLHPIDIFSKSSGHYPTLDGEPLFTLHICVSDTSAIAIQVAGDISESLYDIGVEGVVHEIPLLPYLHGLIPAYYGLSLQQPCKPGEPELVPYSEPQDPIEITVMQGYDMALLGIGEYYYDVWQRFGTAYTGGTLNQGYSNQTLDDLYSELEGLLINWNANFPLHPDLNSAEGERALEILSDLQSLWVEEQPSLVLHSRTNWDSAVTYFPTMLLNLRNDDLNIPEVRRAISLALDRVEIMNLYGYGSEWETNILQTWLPPWFPGYDSALYPEQDILAARQLLYDAGYTNIVVPDSIIDVIDSYVADGTISSAGIGTSLTQRIDNAIDLIAQGKYLPAKQQLISLINELQSSAIPSAVEQELIAFVQQIIDLLP